MISIVQVRDTVMDMDMVMAMVTAMVMVKMVNHTIVRTSQTEGEHWDLIISPQQKFLTFNLKEVWRYRDLLFLFVKRDFVAQYKQTILGPLWHFIQPALTAMMFLIVFGRIAGIPTDGVPPIIFYLTGITLWNYFSTCLVSTSN